MTRTARAKTTSAGVGSARNPTTPLGGSSQPIRGRNSGWQISASSTISAARSASAMRPGRASSPRSGSHARAARSSGTSRVSAPKITRPTSPPAPPAGAHPSSARSARSSTARASTRRLRSKRQPSRMPPASTVIGKAETMGAAALRDAGDCSAMVVATRSSAPGSRREKAAVTVLSMRSPRGRMPGKEAWRQGWGERSRPTPDGCC